MSKEEERNRLEQPVANLEVFEGGISKAAQELTDRMGQLATEGVSEEDLEWMTRVSDAAQSIMGPLEKLFAAINEAPCEASVDEEQPEDSSNQEQTLITPVSETKRFTMPEGLPEEESDRLTKAFDILSLRAEASDRGGIHIRQVVESVFGTRTIPKADFTNFVNHLNKVAEHRGPWYFVNPGTSTEEQTPISAEKDSDQPSDSVIEAPEIQEEGYTPESRDTSFEMSEREQLIWAQILAGGSKTEWFGQKDLDIESIGFSSPSAKNQAFSKFTQRALAAGLLVDNGKDRGSRRYKIAADVDSDREDEEPEEEIKAAVSEVVQEPNSTANEAVTSEDSLTEREQKIIECIIRSISSVEWFKQSEVDLSPIGFSSESARRQAFGKLMLKAIELGIVEDNGKARGGKKYRLLKDSSTESTKGSSPQPAKAKTRTLVPTNSPPTPPAVPYYEAQRTTPTSRPEQTEKALILSERDRLRSERLGKAVSGYVTKVHLTDKKSGEQKTEKVSVIAKDIADRIGITAEEARDLIRNLVETRYFHINGHSKGSPLLSTEAPEIDETDGHTLTPAEIETKRDQERERIAELRVTHERGILEFLSTLTKEQTEFKTAIAAALENEISADDANEICNLLRSEGLLEPKREAGRGSRRTRKGKTWKITGKGRRRLNEIRGEMTNREKKALANGLKV